MDLVPVKAAVPYVSGSEYMETYFRLQRAEGFAALAAGVR